MLRDHDKSTKVWEIRLGSLQDTILTGLDGLFLLFSTSFAFIKDDYHVYNLVAAC